MRPYIIVIILTVIALGVALAGSNGLITEKELIIAADKQTIYLFGKDSKQATIVVVQGSCRKAIGQSWPYDDYIIGARQYFQRLSKQGKPMETYVILLESKSDRSRSVALLATSSPGAGDDKQIRISLKEGKKIFESSHVGMRAYICPTLPQFD